MNLNELKATKATVSATKASVKATIATVKDIIAATKDLISAIIAGGWVAVQVIGFINKVFRRLEE